MLSQIKLSLLITGIFIFTILNGQQTPSKPVSNPIGISHKEIPFENHKIQLQSDDMFYMFSDGIVDQFHYESKEKFTLPFLSA